MSITNVRRFGRAKGGRVRSGNLEFPTAVVIGGENDAQEPPGIGELKTTCRNARLVHQICVALDLEKGGVFRDTADVDHHHHHPADGAFILPE